MPHPVANQNSNSNTNPSDGLLIHLDNGSIVAEPVGLGDRDALPGDGRRMVIGEAGPGTAAALAPLVPGTGMTDIAEEGPVTPAEQQARKMNNGRLAPPDDPEDSGAGEHPSSYADAVRNGDAEGDATATVKDGEEDGANGEDELSRTNSRDRLLD